MRELFDPSLPFFKGNLHTHTTLSDGRLSPEDALESYRARGYDFVALTDHWRPGAAGRHHGMTVLSGVELDVEPDRDQVAHIVGAGFDPARLDLSIPPATAQALIDAINDAGGIAILAHPAWSLNTAAFILSLEGLAAAEIYNSFSGLPWNPARADASLIVDLAATAGRLLPLVASDDSHDYAGEDGLSATFVNTPSNAPADILEALRAGRFFASQGPAFEQVAVEGREVFVRSSACECAIFASNLQRGSHSVITGRDMTSVHYLADPDERFLRVELIDQFGRRAWCSPFALGE